MKAQLNPDVIRRAIFLKTLSTDEAGRMTVEFGPLIETRGQATKADISWLKAETFSQETDAKGIHLILWRDNERHRLYRGDVILPAGPLGFLIISEELASYLMPAFRYMILAEGHEPLSQGEVS